jgi:hypothetical protein
LINELADDNKYLINKWIKSFSINNDNKDKNINTDKSHDKNKYQDISNDKNQSKD